MESYSKAPIQHRIRNHSQSKSSDAVKLQLQEHLKWMKIGTMSSIFMGISTMIIMILQFK